MIKMNTLAKWLSTALICGASAMLPISSSLADDTELFTQPPGAPQPPPNVMIFVDSSANWNANNQHWATGKQGAAELLQIKSMIGQLSGQNVAVGLMFMTNSPKGAYVRSAPRNLTNPANVTALQNMAQAIYSGNFGGGAGSSDQQPTARADYSSAMYEVYNFFSGAAPYSGNDSAYRDFTGNTATYSASGSYGLTTGNALSSATAANYLTPLSATVPCAKNYLIFIGNGLPVDDSSMPGGSSAKIASLNAGVAPSVVPIPGNATAQANWMDEWAKFNYSHGAATSTGISGSIVTYTIDVYKDAQDLGQTALFKSAARVGGGRYFAATSDSEITTALTSIFDEIQSVSSVFSSATLPVSVNVRGTNLNQVYLGVFRPDADAGPNWPGNLKEYKLGQNSAGGLELVDATGAAALSTTTGFFNTGAISFWTSANSYWTFNADPAAQNPNSDSADGPLVERGAANQIMRWDATAATTRLASARKVFTYLGASPATPVDLAATPANYSFASANTNLLPSMFGVAAAAEMATVINWIRGADANDENGDGLTTDVRPRAHGDVIHSRPSVINYNRYGDDNDVAVFYGANDGLLHALQGGASSGALAGRVSGAPVSGGEYWTFAAPEFFSNYLRQADNSPSISWNTTPRFFTGMGYFNSGMSQISLYGINSNVAAGQAVTGSGAATGVTVVSSNLGTGMLISAQATASSGSVAAELHAPGEISSPITTARLTLASNYVTFGGGAAPPSWLATGMAVSGTGVTPGSTVTAVVPTSGAALGGGALATSANTNGTYTFSDTTASSTTNIPNLMVASGSSAAYAIAAAAKTSAAGELYSSASGLGAAIPANSTVTGGSAVAAVRLATTAPTGSAGALDAALTLVMEGSTPTTATTANSVTSCTGTTCTISYFGVPITAPSVGDRLSAGTCSWATVYPTVASTTTTSVTVNMNGASNCSIPRKTGLSFYPLYRATGVMAASGQTTLPVTGTLTRGGAAATLPSGVLLKSFSGASAVSISGAVGQGVSSVAGAVFVETLSAPATANAYGAANFVKTGTLTTRAVCLGTTTVGGASITALGSCTTGTVGLIANGQIVSGPGIPSNTTMLGIVNPGFSMSNPALITTLLIGGQNLSAYYPYSIATVSGAAQIQVSSPSDFALIANGWGIQGAGIPSGTTVVDKAAGAVQFVTLSLPMTGASGAGGSTLTFTNPTGATVGTGPKPYFFDGPIGVYRYDAPNAGTGSTLISGDGKIIAGQCNALIPTDCDQVIIFVPMRRGGRMVYAFDVTNPAVPKLLWKKGCTDTSGPTVCDAGYEEMGQSWSMPQSYTYNIGGVLKPLVVFGGGYDPEFEDQDPVSGSRSMARSVMFVDAKTGVPVKVFKGLGTALNTHAASAMTAAQTLAAASMTCAVPADISVLTKDAATGFTVNPFRAYVGDACGQMWRFDTADQNPDNWIVTRIASVGSAYYSSAAGGSLTGNSLAVNNRKFLFAPDVVYGGSDTNGPFHYVLAGSGDREHPFNGYGDSAHPTNQGVVNRFYMWKDYNINGSYTANSGAPAPLNPPPSVTVPSGGSTVGGSFAMSENVLYDATADLVQLGTAAQKTAASYALDKSNGWYVTLSTAEKTVGGATTSSNYVYFGTNKPSTITNACTNNLGEARLYQVNIATAGAAPPTSNNSTTGVVTSTSQRYEIVVGGGLPPTPVPVAVLIDGKFVEGVIAGTKVSTPSTSVLGNRIRAFTRKLIDKN